MKIRKPTALNLSNVLNSFLVQFSLSLSISSNSTPSRKAVCSTNYIRSIVLARVLRNRIILLLETQSICYFYLKLYEFCHCKRYTFLSFHLLCFSAFCNSVLNRRQPIYFCVFSDRTYFFGDFAVH